MTLAEYLEKHDLKPTQFAELVRVPASTIIRIMNGEREPRLGTIARIEAATKGAVTVSDFYKRPGGRAA